MTFGLVHADYSLPEWQAVKLTFFAPWGDSSWRNGQPPQLVKPPLELNQQGVIARAINVQIKSALETHPNDFNMCRRHDMNYSCLHRTCTIGTKPVAPGATVFSVIITHI